MELTQVCVGIFPGLRRVVEEFWIWAIIKEESEMEKGLFTLMFLLVFVSMVSAELVGGYLFDGIDGTQTPSTIADLGGDTTVDLSIGGTAIYVADTPFTYDGNTALDVSFDVNERAFNSTTTAYQFELRDDPFSVSMWVKYTGDHEYQQVVSQHKQETGNGWYLGITSDEQATIFTQSVGDTRETTGTTVLNDGAWHHIVGISDPNSDLDSLGDGEIFLYVDSVLENTYTQTTTNVSDYGDSVFTVGCGFDMSSDYYNSFAGLVDEVAVYNHALSGTDVLALYNATIPIPSEELLDGDANRDGVVSAGDYASVQANFGSTGAPGIPGDANGDGVVSAGDYASVQANFGSTGALHLDGDANGDGVVSAGDYASVQANFGSTGAPGIPGDANGDGVVSAGDYASVQANFGNIAPPVAAVPEPASVCLLSLGIVTLIKRRK